MNELGWKSLLAVPLLEQLVEAKIAMGNVGEAGVAAELLSEIAGPSGRDRIEAAAVLARGRLSLAAGDPTAPATLEDAIRRLLRLGLRLDAARARLVLARALSVSSPDAAIDAARHARNELEAFGATREADDAAALMRSLGVKGRAGPKRIGLLSRREQEVLRLLGDGLSNREIADRLFISPRTAEHYVSRVFEKLGLKSRAESAAYAVRHLASE
ncbi:hypothetical protein BH18ACT5_BH18ACT5_16180 [soil metagenome]